jgi:glutamate-1-semialdehyde 2,1-aminomutase
MSFGAFGGRKDKGIMALFDPRTGALAHSGTFNNNTITMAAGNAALDLYTEEKLKALNNLGKILRKGVEEVLHQNNIPSPQRTLEEIFSKEGPSTDLPLHSLSLTDALTEDPRPGMYMTGQGSMLAMHFCGPSQTHLKELFWHHMLDEGIYIAQRCFIALNLELREEHVDKFVKATEAFVVKYKAALVR